jgi:hypothetical protein
LREDEDVGVNHTALDAAGLREILRMEDPDGFLSIYADATPGRRDETAIEIRSSISAIEHEARESWTRDRRDRLVRRIAAIASELDDLLSSTAHGRGRALIVALASGEQHRIAVQLPFPTAVVLDETPFIGPLVRAQAAGSPAGLVNVTRDAVRAIDARLGEAVEIARHELPVEIVDWRKQVARADPRPAGGHHSSVQTDRFERHLREARRRMLVPIAREISSAAARRGWQTIVVAGEAETAELLADALPAELEPVRVSSDLREHLTASEVAEALTPAVADARARRTVATAERAVEAALAGGPGAVGLADVMTALEEGRVHELILDANRDYAGIVSPDGHLYPAGVTPPGVSAAALREETQVTERLCARALASGANVTFVDGTAAELLAPHDGVAAILRW